MSQPPDGRRFQSLLAGAALILAVCPTALPAQSAPTNSASTAAQAQQRDRDAERLKLGESLFNQDWAAKDAPAGGDGLGPMYNARSCVQCHRQGGVGGSGNHTRDVELLAVAVPLNHTRDSQRRARNAAARAERVHRGLSQSGGTIVLHNFGRNDVGNLSVYDDWRDKVRMHREVGIFDPFQSELRGSHSIYVVRRNTPALFGAGLIDSIPDKVLVELEQEQAKRGVVSGRVSRVGGHVGHFGWRAQMPSLRTFVVSACVNELGLSAPAVPAPEYPLAQPKRTMSAEQREAASRKRGSDLTHSQCDALTDYIASLPAPSKREISGLAAAGEKVFQQIGCAECHPRDLANVQGIYSDLLLHDMGQALEDPIVTPADISSGYSGGVLQLARSQSLPEIPATRITQEWRTPPLWGLSDSAPYLHDGRAPDIDQAIRLHGGEAEFVTKRYADLSPDERQQLVHFLDSLRADGTTVQSLPYD